VTRGDRVPQRTRELHLEPLDGELLLYHPALTRAIRLNPSAARVWQLCDGTRSVQQITDALCGAYPDEASTIAHDVDDTLTRLEREGALILA
jgi:hypothetical protein